ncbi:MAG: hypothetical protein AAGI23_21880 [Bacteroidota bacterium]
MIALRIIYVLNIIVAGQIAFSAITSPARAATTTFQNAYAPTEVMRLVGCLWLAITILSILGLWKPITFSPILLVQLIYKGTWLVMVALPAIRQSQPLPTGMAWFFLVWVLVLPFLIPWKEWFLG